MRYLAELLIGLGCVACGGHTATEPQPASKPDPSGTTAGTGSTVSTPNQGGTAPQPDPEPNPDLPAPCAGDPPICVPDCTSQDRRGTECVDHQYQCGMGSVNLALCAAGACARATRTCCGPTGHSELPPCTADGSIGECAPGFRTTDMCVPEGLGITDCSEIEDASACSSEELVCFTDKCGLNCYCNADESGRLRWECWVNAC